MSIFRGVRLFQTNILAKTTVPLTQITFWKYNGKSIFWIFKYGSKRSKNCNHIGLYQKTAFKFIFGLWEVPKLENSWNMHFHFHAFSGWDTSQSPKLNPKAVFWWSPIYLQLKKKIKVCWSIFYKNQKKGFPLYFQKVIWVGRDSFFARIFVWFFFYFCHIREC